MGDALTRCDESVRCVVLLCGCFVMLSVGPKFGDTLTLRGSGDFHLTRMQIAGTVISYGNEQTVNYYQLQMEPSAVMTCDPNARSTTMLGSGKVRGRLVGGFFHFTGAVIAGDTTVTGLACAMLDMVGDGKQPRTIFVENAMFCSPMTTIVNVTISGPPLGTYFTINSGIRVPALVNAYGTLALVNDNSGPSYIDSIMLGPSAQFTVQGRLFIASGTFAGRLWFYLPYVFSASSPHSVSD